MTDALCPLVIVGFLLFAGLCSSGILPPPLAGLMKTVSTWITVAAMGALALGVDLKAISKVGRPVILTVTVSLAILVALSVALIHILVIR
ncbi:MAG: hypothetical protein NVS1B4_08490 [Gemmatimonadaceae bacterium]